MKKPADPCALIRALAAVVTVSVTFAAGTLQGADERPAKDDRPGTVNPAAPAAKQAPIEELRGRLERVEAELKELRSRKDAARPNGTIAAVLETAYLGHTYYGPSGGSRFFVARLIMVNSTSEPVTVSSHNIVLRADGTDFKLKESTGGLRNQVIQVGGQSVELRKLRPVPELRIPPGGTGATWTTFSGIPAGVQIPTLILRVTTSPGKTVEVNVNEFARGVLGLKVERIGPRGSVALVTIAGELNSVNVGSLIGALDSMVAEKVVRAVIRWTDTAPPVDAPILSWLQQAANLAGRGDQNNPQMPAFPGALRTLHLAAVPNRSANLEGSTGPQARIHKTDAEAVRAALKSAFEVLPRDELLAEIDHGHPLSRIAALAEGGGRLSAADLPLVLKFADDNDPNMQLAALSALRHFGEPPAVEKLLGYARRNAEPTASVAIESLAASRYAAAHQALLEVLKNEQPASRRLIVRILAKYPRPFWSDTIYSFVNDPNPEVAVEALRALVQVGHPRLFEVLKDALARGSASVRDEAFHLLAARTDQKSVELALEFALASMKNGPPSPAIYGLLNRTKDARAIPLLLAQLDRSSVNRSQVIMTLAQIGDQSVAEALARKYPALPDHDKTAVLSALQQLKSPEFRKLAGEALARGDSALASAAVLGLQTDGGPQAVRLLIGALDASHSPTVWSYVTNALGNFATPEAKTALYKARDSQNDTKRNLALGALRALRQRSAGYPFCLQANQSARSERWDEAIARYASAIELDAELPEAYSGRGHAFLQKKKVVEARKDYAKAFELDPFSSEAVTGLGICLVLEGRVEDGIKAIEDSRPRMNKDPLYIYNAACVYGRALEHALKQPKTAERDKDAARYRGQALDDLSRCLKLGFPELDWVMKDPDLDSLHDVPEFKKIVSKDASEDGPGRKGNSGPDQGADKKGGGDAKTDLLFENARP